MASEYGITIQEIWDKAKEKDRLYFVRPLIEGGLITEEEGNKIFDEKWIY